MCKNDLNKKINKDLNLRITQAIVCRFFGR